MLQTLMTDSCHMIATYVADMIKRDSARLIDI